MQKKMSGVKCFPCRCFVNISCINERMTTESTSLHLKTEKFFANFGGCQCFLSFTLGRLFQTPNYFSELFQKFTKIPFSPDRSFQISSYSRPSRNPGGGWTQNSENQPWRGDGTPSFHLIRPFKAPLLIAESYIKTVQASKRT